MGPFSKVVKSTWILSNHKVSVGESSKENVTNNSQFKWRSTNIFENGKNNYVTFSPFSNIDVMECYRANKIVTQHNHNVMVPLEGLVWTRGSIVLFFVGLRIAKLLTILVLHELMTWKYHPLLGALLVLGVFTGQFELDLSKSVVRTN